MSADAEAEDQDICFACGWPLLPGQLVLQDISKDLMHRACCGPEPEAFVHLGLDLSSAPDRTAWVEFASNGNIRRWTTDPDQAARWFGPAALQPPAPAEGWRPIETAPKDKPFDAVVEHISFGERRRRIERSCRITHDNIETWTGNKLNWSEIEQEDGSTTISRVTHWTPILTDLPAAPEARRG